MELDLHIEDDLDDELDFDISDIEESLNDPEIRALIDSIRDDLEITTALENFSSTVAGKASISMEDIRTYNSIVERNKYSKVRHHYKNVSLESFDTLMETSSSITNTASSIGGKALGIAIAIKDGVIAGAKFAKYLYEKVQENIIKLGASWDMVCGLIEKRWLGLAQLVQVYELQYNNLYEKFQEAYKNPEAAAFFSVKLYAAKLRQDGRDIRRKEVLLKAIDDDSRGVAELGNIFIEKVIDIKKIDHYTSQAFMFSQPYKKALGLNANTINEILKDLSKNILFENGYVKDYQAQSRVLMGGKVVYINFNPEPLSEQSTSRQVKEFVTNLSFSSVKKRDGGRNETESVEFEALSVKEAEAIFSAVQQTNIALKNYFESSLPKMLKSRNTISNLIQFASGLTGGNAAFDTIKRFFNQDDNLKAFNLIAPAGMAKLLGTFLGASSFAVFSGIVAASAATYLIDYLRKYIIANLFSMMEVQYKMTDILEQFDHDFVDTLVTVHNQGHRILKKLASSRNWET